MHRVLPPVSVMPTPYGLLASADIAAHQLHGTAARPALRLSAAAQQTHGTSMDGTARRRGRVWPRHCCRASVAVAARCSAKTRMIARLTQVRCQLICSHTHTARVIGAVNDQLAQPNPFACDVFSVESSVPVSRPTGVLNQRCSESRKQAPSVNQSPARGGTRCTAAYSVHGPPCNTSRTVRLVTAPQTTREPGGTHGAKGRLRARCRQRTGARRGDRLRVVGSDFA